jgi:hypothetical protein
MGHLNTAIELQYVRESAAQVTGNGSEDMAAAAMSVRGKDYRLVACRSRTSLHEKPASQWSPGYPTRRKPGKTEQRRFHCE